MGEAGTHPTPTDHVRGPTQTASSGETEGKNRVNSYIHVLFHHILLNIDCYRNVYRYFMLLVQKHISFAENQEQGRLLAKLVKASISVK